MPRYCDCNGRCGRALCCRKVGNVRKRAAQGRCHPCRGLPGRDRVDPAGAARKRARTAIAANAPGVAAAPGPLALLSAAVVPLLQRCASALEKLAPVGAGAAPAPGAVATLSDIPPGGKLRALAEAALAALPGGHVAEVARQYPPGARALACALANGALAAVRPSSTLSGLDTERGEQPSATTRRREAMFLRDHNTLAAIALHEHVQVATIVQTMARRVRCATPARANVLRFLRGLTELADKWL